MNTERYPLDFDALQKGDYIPPETCERIVAANRKAGQPPVTRAHRMYGLALMGVADEIERECMARKKIFRVVSDHDGLRVLTDAEHSDYAREKFLRHERGLVREHTLANTIDIGQLDADQRRAHERSMQIQGAKLSAIALAKRALKKPKTEPQLTDTTPA